MMSLSQPSSRSRLLRMLVVLFILAIAAFSTAPSYFTGHWTWADLPELANIEQLNALKKSGLALPGWNTLEQQDIEIGGKTWSAQTLIPSETNGTDDRPMSEALSLTQISPQNPVILLLRPQTWKKDQPQVEWMDINGLQQWTADSQRTLKFQVAPSSGSDPELRQPVQVEARFLRGWNPRQTYAVLQWYAWAGGGSSSPSQWFWVDHFSQWRDRQRTSWVAVSVLVPIQPLGKIAEVQPFVESFGQIVQATLRSEVLIPSP